MKVDAFEVVRQFERAVAEYTGAPHVVTVNSCTMALLLAVAWHLRNQVTVEDGREWVEFRRTLIVIPKRTYVSVPMSIIHAGGRPTFRDENWRGYYQLKPLPVWDSARWFSKGMYSGDEARFIPTPLPFAHYGAGQMVCVSFHWSKILGIQQGGAILLDDPEADSWLRRARFDGRREGVAPKDDTFDFVGHHCYMSPETAAAGLVRLQFLPDHNSPLPHDDYPDLSQMEIFR